MERDTAYRRTLKRELGRRLERNPRTSLRSFARAIGVSAGTLSRILAGKTLLSLKAAEHVADRMALPPVERAGFLASVIREQGGRSMKRRDPRVRQALAFAEAAQDGSGATVIGALASSGEKEGSEARAGAAQDSDQADRSATVMPQPARSLEIEQYQVIADWQHAAILELTYEEDFDPSPRWIARELGISPAEAKLAWDRLVALDLVIEERGRWKKADTYLTTADKTVSSAALRRKQARIRELAIRSIENDPIEERVMTTVTVCADPALLPEARARMSRFNRELCEFLESGKRERVFVMEVGLFPLQKGKRT